MGEAIGKAGPCVNVEQDVGDSRSRQPIVAPLLSRFDRGQRHAAARLSTPPRQIGYRAARRLGARNHRCCLIELGASLGKVVLEVRGNSER